MTTSLIPIQSIVAFLRANFDSRAGVTATDEQLVNQFEVGARSFRYTKALESVRTGVDGYTSFRVVGGSFTVGERVFAVLAEIERGGVLQIRINRLLDELYVQLGKLVGYVEELYVRDLVGGPFVGDEYTIDPKFTYRRTSVAAKAAERAQEARQRAKGSLTWKRPRKGHYVAKAVLDGKLIAYVIEGHDADWTLTTSDVQKVRQFTTMNSAREAAAADWRAR